MKREKFRFSPFNLSLVFPQFARFELLASAPVLLALRHTPAEEQLAAVAKAYEAGTRRKKSLSVSSFSSSRILIVFLAPASSELLEAQFRFFGHVLPEALKGNSPLLNNAMRSFLQRVPTVRTSGKEVY